VNCNHFFPNVIGQQLYWFINKICMSLAASDEPVAVKRITMNQSTTVRTSLH
jgi:hypothetical protein